MIPAFIADGLESEQAALEQAYARISQDMRHQYLCKVADYPIAARRFAEWPLAFQTLSPAQFAHLGRYLVPTQVKQHLPVYGSADTLFVEAMRALMQVSAVK
ncbi:hypothetical protein GO988_14870 [Hymenobacter sp. HMF4947]|uniref:BLUF domain-containing protein n=1 Tax=Hymenobacter ginkgonis TaxID=2682976 RepID=A0A7K1TGT0_9BACT|nr:hypothetical protein [Hymenobacter ginkgonis]